MELFFKENWDVVGSDFMRLCHDILNGDRRVDDINETIIVLILKVADPDDTKQFRPISLCRVIYKIVSKM